MIWRVCSLDVMIWWVCSLDTMIWRLRISDLLILRVQNLRVAVDVGVGGYDSLCPDSLDLEVIQTQRVAVGVPGGLALYDPHCLDSLDLEVIHEEVIHRCVKILIPRYLISNRLNGFSTNRVRNPFRAGTVKSWK